MTELTLKFDDDNGIDKLRLVLLVALKGCQNMTYYNVDFKHEKTTIVKEDFVQDLLRQLEGIE